MAVVVVKIAGSDQELPLYLRVPAAAALASCHPVVVRRAMSAGELPTTKFGRCVRVPTGAFLAWLERRTS